MTAGPPPGGEPAPVNISVSTETTFHSLLLGDIRPLPDGRIQVSFIVPQTGEVLNIPLTLEAAEQIGKRLLAPRVALPNGHPSV